MRCATWSSVSSWRSSLVYPATHAQFNAVLENADKAHIDYALDVVNDRVRLQLGNRPGAPVTVWHPNVETARAA